MSQESEAREAAMAAAPPATRNFAEAEIEAARLKAELDAES